MSELMIASLVLASLNLILALAVSVVYIRNHRQLRSPFTLALLLFGLFFVLHNAVLIVHELTMMPTFGPEAEVYLLIEGGLQSAALVALGVATLR